MPILAEQKAKYKQNLAFYSNTQQLLSIVQFSYIKLNL